jgi:hypothetical protein
VTKKAVSTEELTNRLAEEAADEPQRAGGWIPAPHWHIGDDSDWNAAVVAHSEPDAEDSDDFPQRGVRPLGAKHNIFGPG